MSAGSANGGSSWLRQSFLETKSERSKYASGSSTDCHFEVKRTHMLRLERCAGALDSVPTIAVNVGQWTQRDRS